MSARYLWDKTGKPDPEVERLESLLAPLGHRDSPLRVPEEAWPGAAPGRPRGPARPAWAWAAAAAALLIVAGLLWIGPAIGPRSWPVARLTGSPRIGLEPLEAAGRIAAGDRLETDAGSSARVTVGRIGFVEVGPNSRLRVVGVRAPDHRMALDHGSLLAVILAPPRQFFVETPSATAVDLGCAYTLEVDSQGNGMLTVLAGWVSLEQHGRESFIPAGARCTTRPGPGPGTPHFTDASYGFTNALALLDLIPPGREVPDDPLGVVLTEARREDALSLWHLLGRLQERDRAEVFDRLAALVPPPAGVTRQGILEGDRGMLDRWWDELGLGGAEAWRKWKRPWPGAAPPAGLPA